MPRVDLSDYEVAHDLLPPVCARCGQPATDRPVAKLFIVDGWWGALQIFPALFALLFFPPLLFFILGFARRLEVRVPLCAAHRDDFARRERAEKNYLIPIWTAAIVLLDVAMVVELIVTETGISCLGLFFVLVGALAASGIISRGAIGLSKPPKVGARLTGVHPAFVAALAEDRARDRVSNPDRRGGHGDIRDDYDDETG